jgi:hypothetical protein
VTELSSRPKWRDLLSLPRSWSLRNEGEPHTLSLLAARSRKSGYAPVLMNESGRVHTGEQIHFPHLAKNERDMGHPQLWLGESFNEACRQASRLIEMTILSRPKRCNGSRPERSENRVSGNYHAKHCA